MTAFTYETCPPEGPALGLIVLKSDERIEQDFARLAPAELRLYVTRVPSAPDVTPLTLAGMEAHIADASRLFPDAVNFSAIGYGCTSGAAQIGPERVAELVTEGVNARVGTITDPLSALIAACAELGLTRLAFLSPYVESVSQKLRMNLHAQGIGTPVFGTFDEAEESKVVRIAPHSIFQAAQSLAQAGDIDGIFLSCTNLNTLDIVAPLQVSTGLPVLSSNLVLGWHMCRLAGARARMEIGLAGEML